MTPESETATSSFWRPLLWSALWFTLWSILAFPVAVLSHEAAHFLAYVVFGFPEPVLHYGSTQFAGQEEFWKCVRAGDWDGASALFAPYQVGLASAAGIIASWVVMFLCIVLAWRKPHPFIVALGFISSLRFLGGVFMIFSKALGHSGSDEGHVAQIFSIFELALQVLGIASMVAAWVFLYRALPIGSRLKMTCLTILGAIVGGFVYIGLVGPLLLP